LTYYTERRTIQTMKTRKSFYFALGDMLRDLGLSQVAARKKYGFDKPGPGYISKTGFQKLCNRPRQITEKTLNVVCNGIGITPADLWREIK